MVRMLLKVAGSPNWYLHTPNLSSRKDAAVLKKMQGGNDISELVGGWTTPLKNMIV